MRDTTVLESTDTRSVSHEMVTTNTKKVRNFLMKDEKHIQSQDYSKGSVKK